MTDFEIRRNTDNSVALHTLDGKWIDGYTTPDTGQDPVNVVATARTDSGQKFYVKVPVTRALLKHDFNVVETRLRTFAEHWEEFNKYQEHDCSAAQGGE